MHGMNIQIQNLCKEFGSLSVLKNIDITVEAGDFVAIVGRSGCGKSTLLRLISSLEKPTSGSILLDGKPSDSINSDIRFVFQESRLLPWRTALKNVVLGSPTRSEEDAKKAMESVGLAGRENDWPGVLSGGQRQRLSLARAIVGNPRVLLLDEPFGALDALTRIEMQQLIEKLWQEQGFTALLVTHDVAEAVSLANRVILMSDHHVALDLRIGLGRPRERNQDFSYYEEQVLNRILHDPSVQRPATADYVI
jgi:sulfonate transport system ATP-binding protein